MTPPAVRCGLLAVLLAAAGSPAADAHAQAFRPGAVSAGVQFQGYDFADALGVEAVNLVLLPLAWTFTAADRVGVDMYTAYARGTALVGGTQYTLRGATDTRIRANYSATPWAVLTVGLNLPTGRTGHTANEARVAAVLSSDLLGFREANFGLGFGATTGIATAHRIGDTGIGAGVSYRMASAFEPSADTAVTYTPGNEIRIRVGLDRNIGRNKLTAGITFQNFARDRIDGRDLFQPGSRLRGDVTYSFRTSPAATWTAFLTDVWRDRGDLAFQAFDPDAGAAPAESLRIGTQNLLIAGIAGSWRASPAIVLQPILEGRVLSRQDAGGDGWLLGIGTAVPLRAIGLDIAPGARLSFGSMQGETARHSLWGGEVNLTAAFGAR
jgi:hypothetical protein